MHRARGSIHAARLERRGRLLFALAGVFATYLGRWFMFESIVRLGPAKASAFQVSSPLFAFVLSLAFLGERLSVAALAGMAVTAVGLLILSLADARRASPERVRGPRSFRDWLRAGWALGLASSAAYAVSNVLRGAAVRDWNEPIAGALIGAVVGILLHFAVGSDHANVLRGFRTASRRGIVLFAIGGVVNISAQMCVIAAMKYAPVSVVALITLCTPLLVFPLSYLLLKNEERINAGTVGGAALTLAGIAMIILH